MVNALVTGASGLVGMALVRALLAAGQRVRTFDLVSNPALDALPVERLQGDIRQPDTLDAAFAGVEIVYHTAAFISIRMDEWERLHSVNVLGVQNVLAMCRRHAVRRLVHFSSVEALLSLPQRSIVDETNPLVPPDFAIPYPRSKGMGQRLVQEAIEQGMDAVIVYPAGVLGPEDYAIRGTNQLILFIADGTTTTIPDAGFTFVDVRDVALGAMAAAERAPRGAAYILGGSQRTLAQIARLVCDLTGQAMPRIVPAWLLNGAVPFIQLAARLRGVPSPITRASLYPLMQKRQFSHERASRELGYEPRAVEASIRDVVAWFQQVGRLPAAKL